VSLEHGRHPSNRLRAAMSGKLSAEEADQRCEDVMAKTLGR